MKTGYRVHTLVYVEVIEDIEISSSPLGDTGQQNALCSRML
jgi:hypothetical protein